MILNLFNKLIGTLGYTIFKKSYNLSLSQLDMHGDKEFLEIYKKSQPFTMTSIERLYALFKSLQYIINNKIEGDIVECGVWKGGSAMMCAYYAKKYNIDKKLYLYDTFSGMSKPSERDIDYGGRAVLTNKELLESEYCSDMCCVSLEEVKKNLYDTGYPIENINFIEGKVEDTIPHIIPKTISLLRLDTDWYKSTKHELEHLFPRLSVGGVLIIDDYGHFQGAKDAVDEYFKKNTTKILLNRIDYTGRIAVKIEQ